LLFTCLSCYAQQHFYRFRPPACCKNMNQEHGLGAELLSTDSETRVQQCFSPCGSYRSCLHILSAQAVCLASLLLAIMPLLSAVYLASRAPQEPPKNATRAATRTLREAESTQRVAKNTSRAVRSASRAAKSRPPEHQDRRWATIATIAAENTAAAEVDTYDATW